MDCKNSIREYCAFLGLDLIGFSKCRVFNELQPFLNDRKYRNIENEFEEKDINKRINPFLYMQDGKTIVSIAFPYFHGMNNKTRDEIHFSKYTLGNDYHIVISEYLKKICIYIESLGGKALYFTDNNSLPERYLAKLSGIGFIGKNNTLITEKYGSYVFLGEIITDLIIEKDKELDLDCGSCNLCINSCPTGAIIQKNPNICLSYITQKKDIEEKWFEFFNGRLFGCDTCQDICPFNKNVKKSPIDSFKPYNFMSDINLEKLIFLNNREFKEKYKKTSAGWRGKSIIQRNALINSFYFIKNSNKYTKDILDNIDISSPRLKDIYNRLLNIFKL